MLGDINEKGESLFGQIIGIILSFFSLIFSLVVIYFIKREKIVMTFTKKLLLFISISEIINSVTQLSSIIQTFYKLGPTRNTYYKRMRVCYMQIFLNLFSAFFTLTIVLALSIRIYDTMSNRQQGDVRKMFFKKYWLFFSVMFPLIVSYIFLVVQLGLFQNRSTSGHFRYLTCWVDQKLNYYVYGVFLFILITKGFFAVIAVARAKQYSEKLEESQSTINFDLNEQFDEGQVKNQVVTAMSKTKWYPICSLIYWIIMGTFHFFGLRKTNTLKGDIIFNTFYSICFSGRGIFYSILFFSTQEYYRNQLKNALLCKKNRNYIKKEAE